MAYKSLFYVLICLLLLSFAVMQNVIKIDIKQQHLCQDHLARTVIGSYKTDHMARAHVIVSKCNETTSQKLPK